MNRIFCDKDGTSAHDDFRFLDDGFAFADTPFTLFFFVFPLAFCSLKRLALDFVNCATMCLNSSMCRLPSSLATPYFSWRIPTSCSCFPAMAASSSFITFPQCCYTFPLFCFHCPSTRSQFIVQTPFLSNVRQKRFPPIGKSRKSSPSTWEKYTNDCDEV